MDFKILSTGLYVVHSKYSPSRTRGTEELKPIGGIRWGADHRTWAHPPLPVIYRPWGSPSFTEQLSLLITSVAYRDHCLLLRPMAVWRYPESVSPTIGTWFTQSHTCSKNERLRNCFDAVHAKEWQHTNVWNNENGFEIRKFPVASVFIHGFEWLRLLMVIRAPTFSPYLANVTTAPLFVITIIEAPADMIQWSIVIRQIKQSEHVQHEKLND